jgi:hypothetical protein
LSAEEVMGLYKMKSEIYPPNSVRNVANLTSIIYNSKPTMVSNEGTLLTVEANPSAKAYFTLRNSSSTYQMIKIYPHYTAYSSSYWAVVSSSGKSELTTFTNADNSLMCGGQSSGNDCYIQTQSTTSPTGGRIILSPNATEKLLASETGIKIGNGSLSNPSNGFLEVTANLSNRSIHAVGAIWSDTEVSAPIITDRSGFDDSITMEDILKVKSNGQGEIDYPSLATSLGKTSEQVKTYSMVTELQDKEQCIDKPILDEKGIETGKQPECTTTKQPVQVQQQTGTEQVPARDLGKFASGPYVGIQQLYAELCQQGIKLKHCDLVAEIKLDELKP